MTSSYCDLRIQFILSLFSGATSRKIEKKDWLLKYHRTIANIYLFASTNLLNYLTVPNEFNIKFIHVFVCL